MSSISGAFCVSVMKDRCINYKMVGKCATCVEVCPYDVYALDDQGEVYVQNFNGCVGCRICAEVCREGAIESKPTERTQLAVDVEGRR